MLYDVIVLEPFTKFYCDHVIMLAPNSQFQRKENKNKIKIKIKRHQKKLRSKLHNSDTIGLIISSEFARIQRFKIKKIKRLTYVRNVDRMFNKKEPIEYIVEVNIYYQEHRKRTEMDVIGEQKQNVILGMLQLTCHNFEINWRIEKVKMMRCLEECEKQQRPKQEKPGWKKQKREKQKEKEEKRQEKK